MELITFFVMTLLYLLILMPQIRLINFKYDPHIGNLTASRVGGQSLASIFFNYNFGIPIPILSFSIQYGFFKKDLKKYKIFHSIIVSTTGPLLYLFTNQLLNNQLASFTCAILYVFSFHCPVVGNWLIQSEHYENIFFLSGGFLLLAAGDSPILSAIGALLLGCCLLCKFPALLSIWLITIIVLKGYSVNQYHTISTIIGFYLAPIIIYIILGKLISHNKSIRLNKAIKRDKSIIDILKAVPARYLYFYKRNPDEYFNTHIKYHLVGYLEELLPIVVLAISFFLFGTYTDKWVIGLGVAIVSLIFILRMSFALVYSFNIVFCIAAGLAFFSLPQQFLGLLATIVTVSTCFSFFKINKKPITSIYKKTPPQTTAYDNLATYIRENSEPTQPLFCNINYSMAFMYPLSERGLPCHANLLTIGAYGPWIDCKNVPTMIEKEGSELVSAIAASSPQFIIQSLINAPILNLSAIEQYCNVSYRIEAVINPFVIYSLMDRKSAVFDPDCIDIPTLFNAEQGLLQTRTEVELFMKQIESARHTQETSQPPSFEDIMSMKDNLSKQMEDGELPTTTPPKPSIEKSCLFINTYYGAFLNHIYCDNPQLAGLSYSSQLSVLQGAGFGDSDFYSRGLSAAGWSTINLIVNCSALQLTWARENNIASNDLQAILLEQIKKIKPTVVYLQDVNIASPELLSEIRKNCDLLVAQHASPIPQHVDFSAFDIVFTAAPHFVELFRKAGTACYYQPLAFDPRCVPVVPPYQARSIGVSFVGGFSNLHVESYRLFEHLAATTPINFWGYGADTLPVESAIRSCHHGEAWGKEMFKIMANSRITINRHGEIAENHACNMRLYEATGAGTLLITDYKDNLNELFEIGKEVVAYRSPEECAYLVNYYLAHPDEAEAIARAGRVRALREHTYACRMAQTATILERHIRYRNDRDSFAPLDLSQISYGHTGISESEVTKEHVTAWQDPSIPFKQRALVQQELERVYKGEGAPAYRVLAEIIKPYITNDTPVLELGCSSGYCYELLEYYLNRQLDYTGVDYSLPMIDMARDYYPAATFFTADGANLFFADRLFRIVVSSCVLLHVPNWRQHIFETVRVADKYVVASRTPVCRNHPTRYMKKYAYGVETVELLFNEAEIVREFLLNGLELIDAIQYNSNLVEDIYDVTYLFKRP